MRPVCQFPLGGCIRGGPHYFLFIAVSFSPSLSIFLLLLLLLFGGGGGAPPATPWILHCTYVTLPGMWREILNFILDDWTWITARWPYPITICPALLRLWCRNGGSGACTRTSKLVSKHDLSLFLTNFETGSKLKISPYLFNHHYGCQQP